ncbi:MAG: CBS domain-containing protein [Gemmatimonadota bacterium]
MKANEIMTPNPVTVRLSDPVSLAAELMRKHDVGAIPVIDDAPGASLRGIITDRDIVVRCSWREHIPTCPVSEHMSPAPLKTVLPTDDVETVIAKMESAQVRRLPVVSSEGKLVGMIAQADVAKKVGPQAPKEVEELLAQISAPARPKR